MNSRSLCRYIRDAEGDSVVPERSGRNSGISRIGFFNRSCMRFGAEPPIGTQPMSRRVPWSVPPVRRGQLAGRGRSGGSATLRGTLLGRGVARALGGDLGASAGAPSRPGGVARGPGRRFLLGCVTLARQRHEGGHGAFAGTLGHPRHGGRLSALCRVAGSRSGHARATRLQARGQAPAPAGRILARGGLPASGGSSRGERDVQPDIAGIGLQTLALGRLHRRRSPEANLRAKRVSADGAFLLSAPCPPGFAR